MRKTKFSNDNYYHIYNRGTDKRQIFLDNSDYARFIHYLYEFNDKKFDRNISRKIERGSASFIQGPRAYLWEIVAFCLMPNHFHLILKQLKDDGIAQFMQKIGTGYTMFFNNKNQRSGGLFQGRFKAISIENDEYLMHLSRYVHLNPVELIESGWKVGGIKDWGGVGELLGGYRWSSYLDYTGIKNFPSLINKEIVMSYFKDGVGYASFINNWLGKDLEYIKQSVLE